MKQVIINSVKLPVPTITQGFWQNVQLFPERRALEFAGDGWSYKELGAWVCRFSATLQQQGIRPGEIIVIDGERSPALVVAMLAVASIGAVFHVVGEQIPLEFLCSTLQPVSQLHWIRAKAGPAVSEPELRHLLGNRLRQFVQLELAELQLLESIHNDTIHNNKTGEVTVVTESSALLYLNATSGSTGTPKLIKGSHAPVTYFIDWYTQTFNLQPADKFSFLSGLGYDPMLRDIFTPLSVGGILCIPSESVIRSKDGIVKWLHDSAISVIHLTPALARIVFRSDSQVRCPALRLVALGGEPVPVALAQAIRTIGPNCQVVNCYGTTETPQVVCYHVMSAEEFTGATTDTVLPLGKAVGEAILTVEDEHDQPVEPDQVGEICIQSPYLFQGYLTSHKELQQTAFRKYRTGDLGWLDREGVLRISGRKDRQIKYRGHRINLEMIETIISQFSHIQHCAVVFDPQTLERVGLTCYFEAKPGGETDPIELTKRAADGLPTYMRPLQYVCLPKMPLTSSGKVDRQGLNLDSAGSRPNDLMTASRATMRQLQQIWADLLELRLERISLTDNFFDLGGNSLLAARLTDELRHSMKCRIEVTDLFMHPNIKALASYLSAESVVVATTPDTDRLQQRQQHINAVRSRKTRTVS